MSEFIQNKQFRQDKLKELIKRLHDGATVEQVQEEFDKLTTGVTATEIAQMEQALVNEGMPVADIQRLCDVHAAVFKGSIEDIHKEGATPQKMSADHPVLTLKAENTAIQALLDDQVLVCLKNFTANGSESNKEALFDSIILLKTIDKHYSRKENLIFPIMEKYDITAPPQVMWGVDDEIRDKIKSVIERLEGPPVAPFQIEAAVSELTEQVTEMIFKEEEIMIPMVLDKFSLDDWRIIEASSAQIGFTLIDPPERWQPQAEDAPDIDIAPEIDDEPETDDELEIDDAPEIDDESETDNAPEIDDEQDTARRAKKAPAAAKTTAVEVRADSQTPIKLDAGSLTSQEVNSILNTIPLDMTFVGADDRVKYFTQGKERVFDRPPTIIGRQVKHCHPPKSVHIVEQIIDDLRSGKKDNEDFWIQMGEVFAYIRYFAVRGKAGEYLGTLEVTQDIKNITELEGEKRLRK